ncbi:MAG: stage III sporulation protein AF [Pelotomaculum sp.]|nr:stage III sporulation protein AF [Pelotomaculum sp.]
METIRGLVLDLTVIVALAVFLEMLLPQGGIRKYVRLVLGLLIIIAVVQAAGEIMKIDGAGELPALSRKEARAELPGIIEAGRKIDGEHRQKALEQYRKGLAGQVMALAGLNKEVPVISAEVEVHSGVDDPAYGRIKEIVLVLSRDADPAGRKTGEGAAAEVEPVTVQVGRQELRDQADTGTADGPPGEAVADLINTVAGFYNLKPEQVRVVYK